MSLRELVDPFGELYMRVAILRFLVLHHPELAIARGADRYRGKNADRVAVQVFYLAATWNTIESLQNDGSRLPRVCRVV